MAPDDDHDAFVGTLTCTMHDAVVRPVRDDEYDAALRLVVAGGGEHDIARRVDHLKAMAEEDKFSLRHMMVVVRADELIGAAMFIAQVGGTASVMAQVPDADQAACAPLGACLLDRLWTWGRHEGCQLAQWLIEPSDRHAQEIGVQGGFTRLTDLISMARDLDADESAYAGTGNVDGELTWVPYHDAVHDRFAAMIERSWIDSADFPELTGIRTVDQAMAGYRAAGIFDPALWRLYVVDGQDAGVLLLNSMRLARTVELTYIGAAPEYRGRGLGSAMMDQACTAAVRSGAGQMTLAVDCRNHAAFMFYRRRGFMTLLRKTLLIRLP